MSKDYESLENEAYAREEADAINDTYVSLDETVRNILDKWNELSDEQVHDMLRSIMVVDE